MGYCDFFYVGFRMLFAAYCVRAWAWLIHFLCVLGCDLGGGVGF